MDKATHGTRLAAAMASRRLSRQDVADHVGKGARTVTNWTSGATMPSDAERSALRQLLGDYDNPGDAVEVAVMATDLTADRKFEVLALYTRLQREQQQEQWSESRRRAIGRLRGQSPDQSPDQIAASDEVYSIDDEAEETERST